MALHTKTCGDINSVYDYQNLSADEKLKAFVETISEIPHAPNYWFDFKTIDKKVDKHGPEICMLDYLHGKDDAIIKKFFVSHPDTLKTIPYLLGIREDKMNDGVLNVFDAGGDYQLDFKNIDGSNVDSYIKFLKDSGLLDVLKGNGIHASVHDYTYGVEAGLNSNARKNRSGNEGESHLATILQNIVDNYPDVNIIRHEQTTYDKIVGEWYHLANFPKELSNRRFDGSLFCPERQRGLFAEVNNFNSSGSKSKSVSSEFDNVHAIFSRTPHIFVYITDGKGWIRDTTHLRTIINHVPNVFNYAMVEDGWLEDIARQLWG